MYIKYELYRSRNNALMRREAIEYVLMSERDLLQIDKLLTDLLTQRVSDLPEVQKFGTAYIGEMKLMGIEINDNDYTGEMNKEAFMNYIHDESVMPYLDVIWNRDEADRDNRLVKYKNLLKTILV